MAIRVVHRKAPVPYSQRWIGTSLLATVLLKLFAQETSNVAVVVALVTSSSTLGQSKNRYYSTCGRQPLQDRCRGCGGVFINKKTKKNDSCNTCKCSRLQMVRNIDLPECVIFYGRDSYVTDADDADNYAGLLSLLNECQQVNTAVIVLQPDFHQIASDHTNDAMESPPLAFPSFVQFRPMTVEPPNPRDLYEAIESIEIQPRPFGGSAGFGSKLPDPPRHPLPARTVVFCSTVQQTQAARCMGMRVICRLDNPLADAIVDTALDDVWLDDIATPGSFWLNPPHPRDDDGNSVDPVHVMTVLERENENTVAAASQRLSNDNNNDDDELSDDELARILADLAPLK